MAVKYGIQVDLLDRAGNTIRAEDGRIVAAPGEEFEFSISIYNNFKWYGATRLYVEIALRDGTKSRQFSYDGDETQVLCIRRNSHAGVHRFSEMRLWDSHDATVPMAKKPFCMPPPQPERKSFGAIEEKLPALQARRGCVQVTFVRGDIPLGGSSGFKRRAADPRAARDDPVQHNEPYRYIMPSWFKPLKCDKGTPIVFEFQNTSGETAVEEQPIAMKMLGQYPAPTAVMQTPPSVKLRAPSAKSHTPQQITAGPSTNPVRSTSVEKAKAPIKVKVELSDDEDGDFYEDASEAASDYLVVPKRKDKVKVKVVVSPRRISSKRSRPDQTPSLSPRPDRVSRLTDVFNTPSSAQSTTPKSSQKKRKLQLLELQLKEVKLQQQLLELSDEEE